MEGFSFTVYLVVLGFYSAIVLLTIQLFTRSKNFSTRPPEVQRKLKRGMLFGYAFGLIFMILQFALAASSAAAPV